MSVHRYFNCNNIWVSLRALERALAERGGVLELPMIVNRKTVDPSDPASPEVIQLETAMGSAIGLFEGAGAVHCQRARFVPVKKTNDLLVVRSDAYALAEDWTLELAPARDGRPPHVELDPDHFKLLAGFEERFARRSAVARRLRAADRGGRRHVRPRRDRARLGVDHRPAPCG